MSLRHYFLSCIVCLCVCVLHCVLCVCVCVCVLCYVLYTECVLSLTMYVVCYRVKKTLLAIQVQLPEGIQISPRHYS